MQNAREKLFSKGVAAIVANHIAAEEGGFERSENSVIVLLRDFEAPVSLPLMPKIELADRILDEILRLRARGKNVTPRSTAKKEPSGIAAH